MIKAVIFDLWQTTLCSGGDFGNKLIKALDLPIKREEELWEILADDWMKHRFENMEKSAEHACRLLGIKDGKKIKKFADTYRKDRKYVRPYKDTIPAVKKLRKKYKTGLLSNTEYFVIPVLEDTGFLKLFDAAFFSCDHSQLKPEKEFFFAILKALAVMPGEAVMVGDSIKNDIIPAKQLGMKTVFIDRHNKHPEIKDRITSFRGLEKILQKM